MRNTPGPWKLKGVFNVTDERGRGVATCGGYADGKDGTYEENLANAALIAAAPEMLEALKYARRFLKPEGADLSFIDAAIAKAEGRNA